MEYGVRQSLRYAGMVSVIIFVSARADQSLSFDHLFPENQVTMLMGQVKQFWSSLELFGDQADVDNVQFFNQLRTLHHQADDLLLATYAVVAEKMMNDEESSYVARLLAILQEKCQQLFSIGSDQDVFAQHIVTILEQAERLLQAQS